MTELTKERLQEIVEDGFLKHGEGKAMARQLLASMEQGPVAYNGIMPDYVGVDMTQRECYQAGLTAGKASKMSAVCWCRTCRPVTMAAMRFVVCPDCGNKRCPRANDCRNACSGSNESGQEGSAYPALQQEVSQIKK
ncbi:hypothetical protein M8013_20590 [Enterobacteriaceae bacterium H4N4]|uniref:Uncharacterized protein n=1 Tax=Silvania confinis TaxID=2926470 RepID=A0A9J6QJT9_9ENTR|nr:hypothetical protein [Silvania confinis]MCU6671129.1 hypothetical protein [Silvania confinis]